MPDDGFDYGLVNGELIRSPKNNSEHGDICMRLAAALQEHAAKDRLGVLWDSSTGFWMRNSNCRAPDISFVQKSRLTNLCRPKRDFFESGTQIAGVIDPERQTVEVWHSLDRVQTVERHGALDGEQLLPGFDYPVEKRFEEWNWD